MIKVDSHYIIGRSHLNNEDFAISGSDPSPYLILADGCSASSLSDIGARMLVMSAKEYLLNHIHSQLVPNPGDLGLYAALKAEAAVKIIGAPDSSIDATLIVAFIQDNQVYVYVYGDGSVFYNDQEQGFSFINVEYTHNAPYYPSYKVNKARDASYRCRSQGEYKSVSINGISADASLYEPTVIKRSVTGLSSLVISSDGVSSFVNIDNGSIVDELLIAEQLAKFKNTNGDFVKRRVKRLMKLMSKEAVYNSDDLSIAAMVFA